MFYSLDRWYGSTSICIALIPKSEGQDMFLMKAEVPGPIVGKLVSKVHMTREYCMVYMRF